MSSEDPPPPEEAPEIWGPVFPPIPATADPQAPSVADDPLAPAVPAYPEPEPLPDPAPDWLKPD